MTDLLTDINVFIISQLNDLDMYWDTGIDEDIAYKNAQLELLGRLKEIVARYEE